MTKNPDLRTVVAGVELKNPVIAASGTFGYGREYAGLFDPSRLGGVCSKGLTCEPRSGNPGLRVMETPSGLINSIGLENPGIKAFIERELPYMNSLGTVVIANVSGFSARDYARAVALLNGASVRMIELNISCPNAKGGGMVFGLEPEAAGEVTGAVRAATSKPLIVKLSPNTSRLCDVAESVIDAGADALSLANTFQALAIDIERARPAFENVYAGLSGPAIKPLALRAVWDVCRRIDKLPENKRVPVVGIGGIQNAEDAVEFIMAGASAVQIGAATFANPYTMIEVIEGLERFMLRRGFTSLESFRGAAAR